MFAISGYLFAFKTNPLVSSLTDFRVNEEEVLWLVALDRFFLVSLGLWSRWFDGARVSVNRTCGYYNSLECDSWLRNSVYWVAFYGWDVHWVEGRKFIHPNGHVRVALVLAVSSGGPCSVSGWCFFLNLGESLWVVRGRILVSFLIALVSSVTSKAACSTVCFG